MGIIVQKFGGSSVSTTENLFKVCDHIIKKYDENNQVIVVVSAQGKTTDGLIKEALEISENPSKREMDVLLSTGEQISISKLAICLEKLGYKAKSFTGWQIPIITDGTNENARIKSINTNKIKEILNDKYIVIVAGFQGIDEDLNITTLGRGGSDTTAVALAASLGADKVEIYTDVDGVFSSDPKVISNVKKLETVSYDDMLELASSGAKVLHNRCVEIGKKYHVPIIVKSTFQENSEGTVVMDRKEDSLNDTFITGIAKVENLTKISIIGSGMVSSPKIMSDIFDIFHKNNISIYMIITSETKISVLVDAKVADLAMNAIHNKFF